MPVETADFLLITCGIHEIIVSKLHYTCVIKIRFGFT